MSGVLGFVKSDFFPQRSEGRVPTLMCFFLLIVPFIIHYIVRAVRESSLSRDSWVQTAFKVLHFLRRVETFYFLVSGMVTISLTQLSVLSPCSSGCSFIIERRREFQLEINQSGVMFLVIQRGQRTAEIDTYTGTSVNLRRQSSSSS